MEVGGWKLVVGDIPLYRYPVIPIVERSKKFNTKGAKNTKD